MKFYIITLLIGLITITSCSTGNKVTETKANESTEHYFAMYRTACYGTCPSYKVTIQKDGHLNYQGRSNVKNIGERTEILTKEQTENLFKSLEKYNWKDYENEYPTDNVDFPGFGIEYANGKTLKKIKGNSNAPQDLKDLTKIIDTFLNSIGY